MININKITTEQRNDETKDIDVVSTLEMTKLINNQDKKVASLIEKKLPSIAKVIDMAYKTIKEGGRVIYFGAGTSGRLGVLDASEILPTFGESGLFIGLIAGGEKALTTPIENAEDKEKLIISDFESIQASKKDLFIGIAASGRTPYVISGLKYAKKINALTASISTSYDTIISKLAQLPIEVVVGPETITGSTRMKSGTAQKLILNMISTGTMVKLGKVYSNLMVDVKSTNKKLEVRAINMISQIANIDLEQATKLFEESEKNVKTAIVMHAKKLTKEQAIMLLEKSNGFLRKVLE